MKQVTVLTDDGREFRSALAEELDFNDEEVREFLTNLCGQSPQDGGNIALDDTNGDWWCIPVRRITALGLRSVDEP
jgi:hypothetical protein